MLKTEGLIETHFHGAFGIDFMNCSVDDFVEVAVNVVKYGVTRIYPTLMTGNIDQIKEQIEKIKTAIKIQPHDSAVISGIHLEGPFINKGKKGIHQEEFILDATIDNFKKIEDPLIKIVTFAPECDKDKKLCQYLHSKGILLQAGHTLADDLTGCDGVTHLFNAMGVLSHKIKNIISESLTNDSIFVEMIADGNHIIDNVLKMVFKLKPHNKIILISDALPQAESGIKSFEFAAQTVYLKNGSYYDDNGTLAGCGMLLCNILKRLVDNNILSFNDAVSMMNIVPATYLNVKNNGYVTFDDNINVIKTKIIY